MTITTPAQEAGPVDFDTYGTIYAPRGGTQLAPFGLDGRRVDARLVEGRESADGRQSGVRSTFSAPDRFEVRSWSSFEPAAKDATLSEATPEKFRIAEDGRIVEEAAGK